MRISGKIALVTGGASGMGLAFTRRLAQEGAKVYFTDLNVSSGKTLEALLRNENLRVEFIEQNVAREEDWVKVIGHIRAADSRLDVLVNNAGIAISGNIENCSLENFHRVLDVNLTGVFLGCKHGLSLMKDNGGSIINMSSITAICGEPLAPAYSASKAGVRLLSKSVALHCAERGYAVRVNSLHPGYIETPILESGSAGMSEAEVSSMRTRLANEIPVKRRGKPEEVAGAVIFLASDDSVYVTGTEMIVDGGYSCH